MRRHIVFFGAIALLCVASRAYSAYAQEPEEPVNYYPPMTQVPLLTAEDIKYICKYRNRRHKLRIKRCEEKLQDLINTPMTKDMLESAALGRVGKVKPPKSKRDKEDKKID